MSIKTLTAIPNQQIHDEILAHAKKEGSPYGSWYVGIAADAEDRLGQHGINTSENKHWWIVRKSSSEQDARTLEKFMIDNYSFSGGPGGGSADTVFVYAYRKVVGVTKE